MNIHLGQDRQTGKQLFVPLRALDRHMHLVGVTGSGKTTALITLLTTIFCNPVRESCVVIIDRLGGFSEDLLRWFASEFCPDWVRQKLLYIEAAREDLVVPMNPLLYGSPGEGYYRTAHAMELMLRGWADQDLSSMPRLARWLFNSFWGAAQLGLTIGDCIHLLRPRSPFHKPLVGILPQSLRWEWEQIHESHGDHAERILESSQNRLTPIFESPGLRAMFSSSRNYLDVHRWMREKRLVLLNLAPMGRLPEAMADTIAGLVVNEVFSVARSLAPRDRQDTLLVLDEFQRFISKDLELALAESRQLKTRLILSHQSLSQLKRNDVDLTSLIFQAQTRLMLKSTWRDATLLAEELAALTFDPYAVKDEIWHRAQRVSGHRVIELASSGNADSFAKQWSSNHAENWAAQQSETRHPNVPIPSRGAGSSHGRSAGESSGGSESSTASYGKRESLLPEYEEYVQLASRNFWSWQEIAQVWGKLVREQDPGEGILQVDGQKGVQLVRVKETKPGHLAYDWDRACEQIPEIAEDYARLRADNFAQDYFVSPAVIVKEAEDRLERVLRPVIALRSPTHSVQALPSPGAGDVNPFRSNKR